MEILLEAKTEYEKMLREYLQSNSTDLLIEKINTGKKTLKGCWNYITKKAREKAVGNCACVEDAEVFGWASHYFEEDQVEEEKTGAVGAVVKKEAKPKPKKDGSEQMSLLDIFG